MNRASDTMVIDGHILSDRDLEVFWAFHEIGTFVGAAKRTGVSKDTVKRIVESPWAKRLFDTKVRQRNESLMHRLQEMDDKAMAAYEEIITGQRSADKSTMAQAKLIELRLKAGKNPILDTRSTVTNIHNEQKNSISLTPEQMKEMTQDELIEVNRTAVLPERMRVAPEVPRGIEFPKELPADWSAMKAKPGKLQVEMEKHPEPDLSPTEQEIG